MLLRKHGWLSDEKICRVNVSFGDFFGLPVVAFKGRKPGRYSKKTSSARSPSHRLQTALFLGGLSETTNTFLCYFELLHHIKTPGIHFMAPTLSREIKTGKCSRDCGITPQNCECDG